MSIALVITGVIVILVSANAGLSTNSLLGFFIWLTSGVSIGMILFAFSQIITNQLDILHQLQTHNEFTSQLHTGHIKCLNCEYEYEDTYSSCPNCGNRESK